MKIFTTVLNHRRVKLLLFFSMLFSFYADLSYAQTTPYKLEGNWQTGGWVNPIAVLTARRTNTMMCRAQATAGTSKQAVFNNSSSNYNPKWGRPTNADVTKNTRIAGGAVVNGAQDIYFVRTTNNYYTFVIGNTASANNDLSILETTYNPTTFGSSPTQSPVAASVNPSDNVVVTVTLSANPQAGENVFIRYSNDNFSANFNVVQVTGFSAGVGTATIPSAFNTGGTTVSYYPFTTNSASPAAADADYLALRVQTQSAENGAIWSYTVSSGGPTLTTVAANTIGTTTASSGGQTITSGSALTAKGVVWSLSTTSTNPDLITKDGFTDDGTAISNFTSSLTGLTPGMLYYVRAYATNGTGTGYGTASSFYTLSSPPSAQATGLTATSPTSVGFDHTWTAATIPGTGGYILLASTGTPSLSNGNGAAPVASAGTIIVNAAISSAATSYTSTGLSASTTYNFLLIPYTWNGANAATYNYLTASAPSANNTTAAGPSISGFTSITAGGVYTGETITINGTNLGAATAVSFNGTAAVSFTPGASSITATVALGTNANGNISVTIGGTPYTYAFNYLGYRTANDGDWTTAATWLGNILPSVANRTVTVAHLVDITTNLSAVQTGAFNILANKSITFGAAGYLKIQTGNAFTNNGTVAMTAGGTLEFVGNANFTNNNVINAAAGTIYFSGGTTTINGSAAITFYNLTLNAALTISTSPITVNHNLQINGGNIVTASAITYGATSTLIYNTGYTVFNEWTANATGGAGVPKHVQIGNGVNSAVTFGSSTAYYQLNGDLLISPGSSLTLSSNAASPGLKFTGSFTNNGTFTATGANGRGLWFVGTSNQTLSSSTALTLSYLLLNSTSDLKLSGSDFTLSGITSALQFLNSGGLDLNQRTLTLNASGTILLNAAGTKTISSTGGTGTLALSGTNTLTATSGTLTTNSNVAIILTGAGLTISAANALTIQGSLQLNAGAFIATTNAPVYGAGSTLYYNSGSSYGVSNEWIAGAIAGAAGVPSNVQIGNGAINSALNLGGGTYTLTGNLTFSNNTGAALTSSGTLNIGGDWANNTVTPSSVANFNGGSPVGTVVFNGSAAQAIKGNNINAGGYAFNSMTIKNTSGISAGVTLNMPVTIGTASTGTLTLTTGVLNTTLVNTATIKNTGSGAASGGGTTSYVNGPLNWTLPNGLSSNATVYNFPTGDAVNNGGAYLPFSITKLTTGATGPVLQVQASNTGSGGTADGTTLTAISNSEYWSASILSGNYSDGSVSLTRQSALGSLNVIGRAATKTAINYASLAGTVSGTSVNNSSATGSSLGFFVLGTAPSVAITSNSPAAGNVLQGSTSQVIQSIKLVATGVNSSLTGATFTTGGSYSAGDFINFTLWINSSNSLSGATQLGSTIVSGISPGGALAFTSGANLPYILTTATGTYYLLVTADVAVSATPGNYINIAATAFTNISFAGTVNKTGTDPVTASNNQTVFFWSIRDFYVYVGGTGYYLNGSGGQGSSPFNGASVSTNNFYLNDIRLYTRRVASQSICKGTMYYSIYPTGGSPSTWTAISLPALNSGNTTGSSGTDAEFWGSPSNPNINVGCGLTNGSSYKFATYWTFSGDIATSVCPGTADVYTLNNGGNYYTLTFTYTNSSYTPTFSTAPATSVCINGSVTYTTQTGRSNYVWSVPGIAGTDYTITAGGISSTDYTVTLTWKTAGVKTVTVGYTNGGCASATPASFTTTVAGIPTVSNAGTALSTCVNTGVTLAANTPLTGTGAWTVSGPSSSTLQFNNPADPAAIFTPTGGAGTYTLTWTISSSPCTVSASNVTVIAIAGGTWIGPTSNGDWNVAANWCGGVPTSATNVIVPSGNVIDIKTADAFANNITFNTSTAGIRMLNTYNLNIYGNLTTANGIFNASANTGKVYFVGNSTISGSITFKNVAYSGGIDFGTQSTVTDTLVILPGGYSNINGPIYAVGSTLKYMTGGNYLRRVEWSQASGAGYPYNVWVSNNTQLYAASSISLSANTVLNAAGDLTIDNGAQLFLDNFNNGVPAIQSLNMNVPLIINGSMNLKGNLSMSSVSGADIKVAKDWNFTVGANFYQNGRAVFFNGGSLQTISRSAAGTLNFGITINNNTSGGLQLASGTNINFNAAATDALQMLGTGTGNVLDLNGNTATLTSGGNINISGTPGIINTGVASANFNITGGGNVNGSGSLGFGTNLTVGLNGLFDFGSALSTVNGTLSVNANGAVNLHPPYYGTGSTLIYNIGGNYNRSYEWSDANGTIFPSPGFPYSVMIQNNTTLHPQNGGAGVTATTPLNTSGDLTIISGSSFLLDAATAMTLPLRVGRNLTIDGILNASTITGADIYIGGNWDRAGTFIDNDRKVIFDNTNDVTLKATGGQVFPYMYINKNNTTDQVTLLDSLTITKEIGLSKGVFSLADKNVTLVSSSAMTARVAQMDVSVASLSYGTGKFIVQRYIYPHRAWRLLTAPVIGQTISEAWQEGYVNSNLSQQNGPAGGGYGTHITAKPPVNPVGVGNSISGAYPAGNGYDAGPNNASLYTFSGRSWSVVPPSTKIPITVAGQHNAYLVFVRGDRTAQLFPGATPTTTILRPKGTLITGDQSISFAAGDTGFKAIGNPYASTINFSGFSRTNVSENYYIWDPRGATNGIGAYVTLGFDIGSGLYYPVPDSTYASDPIDTDGSIQSGQGFVAYFGGTDPGNMTIHEADKRAQSGKSVFRRPTEASDIATNLRINLYSGGTLADGAMVIFNDKYSNDADLLEDAKKVNNLGENLSIYRHGQYMAIEKRQLINGPDTIFLSPYSMREQQYYFKFIPAGIDQPNLLAFLEDRYTNSRTPIALNCNTTVSITINSDPASKALDRFRIVFGPEEIGTLPVTYTSIKAWQQNNNIAVEWKVDNELNIKEYEVERSADGRTFKKVNVIASKSGTGSASLVYDWLDISPASGVYYYRVRSIDKNGSASYSHIVKVIIGKSAPFISVYPNPVKGGIIGIQLNNMDADVYKVNLFNNKGQLIQATSILHPGGNATQTIACKKDLVKGMYQLEIIDSHKNKKVIKILSD